MSKLSLTLSFMLVATGAFAIGELPVVNPARTVSALDLYGAPHERKAVAEKKREVRIAKAADSDLLIPNRPAGDLWSNNGDAPLRMPERHEYMTLKSDFVLPEETLDSDESDYAYLNESKQAPLFAVTTRPTGVKTRVNPADNSPKSKNSVPVAMPKVNDNPVPMRTIDRPSGRIAPSQIKSNPKFIPAPTKRPVRAEPEANDDEFSYNGEVPLAKLSPAQLKRAFKKTFTTENKHLSTYRIDDGFDEASDEGPSAVGFDSSRDLSEQSGGIRPLEIKISFDGDDSALSRDNYNLLTEYASIVSANPKRAVQISISERGTRSYDGRKLAARRLAIVEQVLRDSGIIDKRIIPVLSQRNDDSFVLRVISSDMFQVLSEKKRDMFGDTVKSKTYKSMSW